MDQKHGTKGDGRPKSDIQDPEQPPNPLQFLKWKEGATPKKRQAFTLSLKQLEEQKQRRQAFLALYPHRHIPTRAEIKARKRKKSEVPYISPWDSRTQKLFDPVTWYYRQIDSKVLDSGVEFAKHFGFEEGSIQWKWNSWMKSGRTDLMPIGEQKFYNGLYILTRDDFHFKALDSQGILRTCGLVEKEEEEEAEFDDKIINSSTKVDMLGSDIASNDLRTNFDSGVRGTIAASISKSAASSHNDVISGKGDIGALCGDLSSSGVTDNAIASKGLKYEDLQKNASQKKTRYKRGCIFDSDDSISSEDDAKQCEEEKPVVKLVQRKNANLCFFDSDDSTYSVRSNE